MKLHHLAIWTKDLEVMRSFYVKYFNMSSGEKYCNEKKGFSSYFLSFDTGDAKIELMQKTGILDAQLPKNDSFGIAHFAIYLGDKAAVDALTERLRADQYTIASETRTTGDGYYESAILDPEGNYVEICV